MLFAIMIPLVAWLYLARPPWKRTSRRQESFEGTSFTESMLDTTQGTLDSSLDGSMELSGMNSFNSAGGAPSIEICGVGPSIEINGVALN